MHPQPHNPFDLSFMTPEHHRVRNFVVSELPRAGQALPPETIAYKLGLPLEQVIQILDELERHLVYLFRNPQGEVAWAYPVTVEPTPHRVTFSSGEKIYAAWGEDALATPFVQGQLRNEPLSFLVETQCAHCGQPLTLEIDSHMQYRVFESEARPVLFIPHVDFARLKDPSIIDAFWRNSVFFWSEEHAHEYIEHGRSRLGSYLPLAEAIPHVVEGQRALFGL